jgi:hypothetical protein
VVDPKALRARGQRASAIDIIGQRVAIGVIGDSRAADGGWRMGADCGWSGDGIDQVRVLVTEAGVVDHVVGIIIGVSAVLCGFAIGRGHRGGGAEQPVQPVISIGPGAAQLAGGGLGDHARCIADIGLVLQGGQSLLHLTVGQPASCSVIAVEGRDTIAIVDLFGLTPRIIADGGDVEIRLGES